jgi:hypothetical protein
VGSLMHTFDPDPRPRQASAIVATKAAELPTARRLAINSISKGSVQLANLRAHGMQWR